MRNPASGSVVLFSEPKKGVLLKTGGFHFVGHWRDDWITEQFQPLPVGSLVTLEVAP